MYAMANFPSSVFGNQQIWISDGCELAILVGIEEPGTTQDDLADIHFTLGASRTCWPWTAE